MSFLSPAELRNSIRNHAKQLALEIGFSSVEIAESDKAALKEWLALGYHGDMRYMEDNEPLRHNPTLLLTESVSIISARLNYWTGEGDSLTQLSNPKKAYISRYALGRDYHKVLRGKLKQLCLKIEEDIGAFQWRPFSDSAPLLEHSIARQAGLGFIGKHSLLIHPQAGSTFFLGEILCDLPLLADHVSTKEVKSSCGSCTQCITHCPTQAIVAPFVVDARRCISYLTIEYDGSIPLELRPLIGNRIYGCDDCQLVCPWNKYAQMTTEADFLPRHGLAHAELLTLWQWQEDEFLRLTEGSPIRRIGYHRWRRNLAIALGNAPYHLDIISALTTELNSSNPLVSEHIQWAIQQQNIQRTTQEIKMCQIHRSFLA